MKKNLDLGAHKIRHKIKPHLLLWTDNVIIVKFVYHAFFVT